MKAKKSNTSNKNISIAVIVGIFIMVAVVLFTVNRISNERAYQGTSQANEDSPSVIGTQWMLQSDGEPSQVGPTIARSPGKYSDIISIPSKNSCQSELKYISYTPAGSSKQCLSETEFFCHGTVTIPEEYGPPYDPSKILCGTYQHNPGDPMRINCFFPEGPRQCVSVDTIHDFFARLCSGICLPRSQPTGIGIDPPANPY